MTSIVTHSERRVPLSMLKDADHHHKRWSFSSVYHFIELRDVFLALRQSRLTDIRAFSTYCESTRLPWVKTPWEQRRLLEYVNALINFGLVDNSFNPKPDFFVDSKIGERVTLDEMEVFKRIYFDYFRFKEIHSWHMDLSTNDRDECVRHINETDLRKSSHPLFSFADNRTSAHRYVDSVFDRLVKEPLVYSLDASYKGLLPRFWDVFTSWGQNLRVLEKVNLAPLGIYTSAGKSITCTYILSDTPIKLDFISYLQGKAPLRYFYLPSLVFELAREYRVSVAEAKDFILSEYQKHKGLLSLERTSEIFVRSSEILSEDTILFPKYRDSYISHLIVRT